MAGIFRAIGISVVALLVISRIPAVRRRVEPLENRLFGWRGGRKLREGARDLRHEVEQTVDADLH